MNNFETANKQQMPISRDEILLQVNNLNAGYGKRQVLFNVSLEIKQGEIVLLIGGNGSGKSTLLKSIYRLMPPFENNKEEIIFAGENITYSKPFNLLGKGLVYVAQKNNTFDQLTVKENLEIAANNLNMNVVNERIAEVFKKLPLLIPFKDITPFNLSGGERQQLALAMALMQNPKMILLDEPSAGLSPFNFLKNLELIKTLNKSGISFLIVEHRVKESAMIADKIISLKLGVMDEAHF